MTSSTSSSERTTPLRWRRAWLLAAGVALLALAGIEGVARSAGYLPSVVDDHDLWCLQRADLDGDGRGSVALLGASRLLTGFAPHAWQEVFPDHQVRSLAVPGKGPVAALRDLALESSFNGIVLVSVEARTLVRATWPAQQPWVDYYHGKWTPNHRVDRILRTPLEERLVVLTLTWPRLLRQLVRGRLAPPPHVRVQRDRWHPNDFSRADVAALHAQTLSTVAGICADLGPVSDAEWSSTLAEIEELVRAIQGRGGRVALVHFPSSRPYDELIEAHFPKQRFWDVLARTTSATTVHAAEVPALAAFDCPDGTHLDCRDAPAFTRALARELIRLGFVDAPARAR